MSISLKRLAPAPELDRSLVDPEQLASWMDRQGLGSGPIETPSRLTGGTQNVLVSFTRAGRRYVLRRPPAVPRPGNNETMEREARVLSALAGSDVPHPALIAACADVGVLGAVFYLMEPVEGFNAVNGLPPRHAADPGVRRDMGFALVDGAAKIGRIDHVAVGLGDLGKPANFLERQVDRWHRQLASYHAHEGWPGPGVLGSVDAISDYLSANQPRAFEPGLMHGDYTIGNVMYRHDGPDLAAIVDWELATIGDPLLDLGWIIATWRDPGQPSFPLQRIEPWEGFPSAVQMIQRYAEQSRRDVSSINWYVVLACYKLGIILEGTYARSCSGAASPEQGLQFHQAAIGLMKRALHRIASPISNNGSP